MTAIDSARTGDTMTCAPSLSRREKKSAAVRESIIAAALDVFSEDTFTGARVQNVAERAGVALGTIYNHFENKEALANAVYRRCGYLSTSFWSSSVDAPTARDAFAQWWRNLGRFYAAHPQAFIFLETQHNAHFLDEHSRRLKAKIDGVVQEDLVKWQTAGEVRIVDPPLLLSMVVAVFAALALAARRDDHPIDAETLQIGEDCAWALLGADTH